MRFVLESLKCGCLDARIVHANRVAYISAVNGLESDFVHDLMTALCEVIDQRDDRLVVFGNASSDQGLYLEVLRGNAFRVSRLLPDAWSLGAFLDAGQASRDHEEIAALFQTCGVRRGRAPIRDAMRNQNLGVVSELQLLEFAHSLLAEFSRFRTGKGLVYYHDHWVQGSAAMGGVPSTFPHDVHDRLLDLFRQRAEAIDPDSPGAAGSPAAHASPVPESGSAGADGQPVRTDSMGVMTKAGAIALVQHHNAWERVIREHFASRYPNRCANDVLNSQGS